MYSEGFPFDQIFELENPKERCTFYEDLIAHIKIGSPNHKSKLELSEHFANEIKKDSSSNNENVKAAALKILKIVIQGLHVRFHGSLGIFLSYVLKRTKDNVRNCVQQALMDAIISGSIGFGREFEIFKVKDAVKDVIRSMAKCDSIRVLQTRIIPVLFDRNISNEDRDEILELALYSVEFVNVFDVSSEEQDRFISLIMNSYVQILGELRDSQYDNWHEVWIFLIKVCDKKLHTQMQLANKLLRLVEVAFRNSTSTTQRLRAYDCWRQLIDNCSLNFDYLCSPKQIKLLVTPLKAKFSRMPAVVDKRFETFVYLLEKLGDKSTLCLREFLEFCFGTISESSDRGKTKPIQILDATKAAKTLIAIIGHGHSSPTCIRCEDVIDLKKSVINTMNFSKFSQILFTSVVECSLSLGNAPNQQKVLKCLWGSLLGFIHQSDNVTKRQCALFVSKTLESYLNIINENYYFQVFLACMTEVILTKKLIDALNVREIVFSTLVTISGQNSPDLCSFDTNLMEVFIIECLEMKCDTALNYQKIVSKLLNGDSKWVNIKLLCKVWLKSSYSDISFVIWPIKYLNFFERIEDFNSVWCSIYREFFKGEISKAKLLTELDKLYVDDPLLSSNVVVVVELISSMENDATKEFINRFIQMVTGIVSRPCLLKSDVRKLVVVVTKYLDYLCLFCQSENCDDALKELCTCIKQMTLLHKNYTLLLKLELMLKIVEKRILEGIATNLAPFLRNLQKNADAEGRKVAGKILKVLEQKDEMTDGMLPPIDTPRTLRMLTLSGAGTNTPLPTSFRSCLLRSDRISSKSTNKKKLSSLLQSDDESSSEFVKIDTKVELHPDRLNEHQKEVMKKRRDDIPALYQDLSQSRSLDFNELMGKKADESPPDGNKLELIDVRRSSPRLSVRNSPSKEQSSPLQCSVIVENIDKQLTPEMTRNVSPKTEILIELRKKLFPHELNGNDNSSDSSVPDSDTTLSLRRSKRQKTNKSDKITDSIPSESVKKRRSDSAEVVGNEVANEDLRNIVIVPTVTGCKTSRPRRKKMSHESNDFIWDYDHMVVKAPMKSIKTPKRSKKERKQLDNQESTPIGAYDFVENGEDDVIQQWKPLKRNNISLPATETIEITNNVEKIAWEKDATFDSTGTVTESSSPVKKVDDTFGDVVENSQPVTRRKTRSCTLTDVGGSTSGLRNGTKSAESTPDKAPLKDLTSWLLPNVREVSLLATSTQQTEDTSLATTVSVASEEPALTPIEPFIAATEVVQNDDFDEDVAAMGAESERSESVTVSDLPSSPVTCDTPDRTNEFLLETSSISPISSDVTSAEDVTLIPRSSKLLKMVNATTPLITLTGAACRWKTAPRSPSLSRIRLSTRNHERRRDFKRFDVLTFSREIPSPLTQPGNSILKRKSLSCDDLVQPVAKRKRVNFSDPAITQQKIFIKDGELPSNVCTGPAIFESDDDDDVFTSGNDCVDVRKDFISLNSFLDRNDLLRICRRLFEDCGRVDELRSKLTEITNDFDVSSISNVIDDFLLEPDSDYSIFLIKFMTVLENATIDELNQFIDRVLTVLGRDPVLKCLRCNDDLKIDEFKEVFERFIGKLDDDDAKEEFLMWVMKFTANRLPNNVKSFKKQFEILHDNLNRIGE